MELSQIQYDVLACLAGLTEPVRMPGAHQAGAFKTDETAAVIPRVVINERRETFWSSFMVFALSQRSANR